MNNPVSQDSYQACANKRSVNCLWISDSPTLPTGYGRVTRDLLFRLRMRSHNIWALGVGHDGWPYDTLSIPYPIIPSPAGFPSIESLQRAIDLARPDVIVALGDLWMMPWVEEQRLKGGPTLIGYIPIDGGPLPQSWKQHYKCFDKLVTTSIFSQNEFKKLLPDLAVDVIYHGVERTVFKPLKNKRSIKEKLGFGDRFVVGCVAKNQFRKHFPTLIKAFSDFHKLYPNSLLYLHTSRDQQGWNFEDFLSQYNLGSSVVFPPGYNKNGYPQTSDAHLNEIYNAFDVMVLATTGEGFGLPIIEAMAAGTPVIATDYSSCTELVKGRGLLIEVKTLVHMGGQVVLNAVPDSTDLTKKIEQLYLDENLRARFSKLGCAFARSVDWNTIADQWERVLTCPNMTPYSSAIDQGDARKIVLTENNGHSRSDIKPTRVENNRMAGSRDKTSKRNLNV